MEPLTAVNGWMYPDGRVVLINDQEYLKPCGEQVTGVVEAGTATFCTKMVDHASLNHEDSAGNLRSI